MRRKWCSGRLADRPGLGPDNLSPFAPAQLHGASLDAGAQVVYSNFFTARRCRLGNDADPQVAPARFGDVEAFVGQRYGGMPVRDLPGAVLRWVGGEADRAGLVQLLPVVEGE